MLLILGEKLQQHQKQHPRQQHPRQQHTRQQQSHQQHPRQQQSHQQHPRQQQFQQHHRQFIDRRTVPGNSNYASITAHGKKVVVFGDSLVKRIRGREMSSHVKNGKAFIQYFRGATSKDLYTYVEPTLNNDKPDAVIIHVGTNDVSNLRYQNMEPKELADKIIRIGTKCRENGVNQVFISSIVCRKFFKDNKFIREVNDFLKTFCTEANFIFISNDNITKDFLYNDGVHLLDEGTNLLVNNFIDNLNKF